MGKQGVVIDANEREAGIQTYENGCGEKERRTVKDTPENRARYIEELKQYTYSLSDPNEGRIQELRDMIRGGKLLTKEAIREAAERLSQLFLGQRDLFV
ncbi:MAG TPA: hypothetical protein PKL97_04070 [Candidatus Omnitrophota bacterium]|nr:hypothetical protein [Candidatus Omnitrophota bacterium]